MAPTCPVPAFLSAFAPVTKEAPRGPAGVRVGAAASPSPAVSLEAVLKMVQRTAGSAVDADARARLFQFVTAPPRRSLHRLLQDLCGLRLLLERGGTKTCPDLPAAAFYRTDLAKVHL